MKMTKKKILAINGSASKNSSNLALLKHISTWMADTFEVHIYDELILLPHFQTELTSENTPEVVLAFRKAVQEADGVIICTPEYVFSLPSGLKNAIEWCVSTTVFSQKPIGLVTASASGVNGHEELKLIMKTIETKFTDETTLLIQGVKGKVRDGKIVNEEMQLQLRQFVTALHDLITQQDKLEE